jgi:hypothetical protein
VRPADLQVDDAAPLALELEGAVEHGANAGGTKVAGHRAGMMSDRSA